MTKAILEKSLLKEPEEVKESEVAAPVRSEQDARLKAALLSQYDVVSGEEE